MTIERPKIEKFSDLTEEMLSESLKETTVTSENKEQVIKELLSLNALLQPHFIIWWNTGEIVEGIQVEEFSLKQLIDEGYPPLLSFRSMNGFVTNPLKNIPLRRELLALDL